MNEQSPKGRKVLDLAIIVLLVFFGLIVAKLVICRMQHKGAFESSIKRLEKAYDDFVQGDDDTN